MEDPQADLTPYDVLGVDPDDLPHVINLAYKRLVRSLHPDTFTKYKKDVIYVNGITVNREEASIWLDSVSKAYEKIKKTPRWGRCPQTQTQYEKNNYDVEPLIDIENFNSLFEKNHIPDIYAEAGYSQFNTRLNKHQAHSEKNEHSPSPSQSQENQIVQFYDGDKESNLRCWEITKIDNFNIRIDGKKEIYGCDLAIYSAPEQWLPNRMNFVSDYDQSGPIEEDEINRRLNLRNQ